MADKKTPEQIAKEKEANDAKAALDKMQAMVDKLPENIQAGFSAALSDLAKQQAAAAEAAKAAASDDDDDDDGEVDLERMDRSQFAKWMTGQMIKEVNKVLKPVSQQLETTSKEAEQDKLRAEVQKMRDKYPDFDEFKPEMQVILKDNPGIKIESLYKLAKVNNPEKVAELEKADQEKNPNKGEEKAKFLGLLPTSTNSADDDEDAGNMDPDSAATAAWEEAFKDIPEALFGS